jgi:hypothetical protein
VAAPTLTASYVVASWDVTTGTQTVTVTTAAGDHLVVFGITEDAGTTLNTPSGNGLTYTLARSATTPFTTAAYAWTAVDAVGGSSWTLTVTRSAGSGTRFGVVVFRFANGNGFDASNVGSNATNSAPSVSLTTAAANSAVAWANGDWTASDGTSRTWRTVNGITPTAGNGDETVYFRNAAVYTVYAGYWPDAGAAAANSYGLSAPSAQAWSGITVGVKGVTSSFTPAPPPAMVLPSVAVVRSTVW